MSEVNPDRGSRLVARGSNDTLAECERELQAALSIEPSPEFEARVRQRVDADRQSTARIMWFPTSVFPTAVGRGAEGRGLKTAVGWGLKTPALQAAASLLLIAGAIGLLQRTTPDDPVQAPQMATERPDVALPAAHALTPPAHEGPAYQPEVGRGFTPRRSAREPEVIVVNQMAAVRRLVDAVNDGRMAVGPTPAGPVEPPSQMIVDPLVVEPMAVPAMENSPVAPVPDKRKTQ